MFGSREFRTIFKGRAKKYLRTPDLDTHRNRSLCPAHSASVIFVENGVISLVSVALKVHQMMLLWLLSLCLFSPCTDLPLLLLI